ncbi:hypothetical protein STRDD13_01280 [Streptococcus sp. DD13]|nr:hypothetical protein STRDD13_01280 [Streptococcus sp. DD13]
MSFTILFKKFKNRYMAFHYSYQKAWEYKSQAFVYCTE